MVVEWYSLYGTHVFTGPARLEIIEAAVESLCLRVSWKYVGSKDSFYIHNINKISGFFLYYGIFSTGFSILEWYFCWYNWKYCDHKSLGEN